MQETGARRHIQVALRRKSEEGKKSQHQRCAKGKRNFNSHLSAANALLRLLGARANALVDRLRTTQLLEIGAQVAASVGHGVVGSVRAGTRAAEDALGCFGRGGGAPRRFGGPCRAIARRKEGRTGVG